MIRKNDKPLQQIVGREAEMGLRETKTARSNYSIVRDVVAIPGGLTAPAYRKITWKFQNFNKKAGQCVLLKDGSVVLVSDIATQREVIHIYGQEFRTTKDFYTAPAKSSHVGIFLASDLGKPKIWSVREVGAKAVAIPMNGMPKGVEWHGRWWNLDKMLTTSVSGATVVDFSKGRRKILLVALKNMHDCHLFDDYTFAREVLKNSSDVTDLDERIRVHKRKKYGRGKQSPKRKAVSDYVDSQSTESLLDLREHRHYKKTSVLTVPPSLSSDKDECESIADATSDAGRPPRENRAPLVQMDSSQLLKILERMANSMERMEINMKSLASRVLSLEEVQKAILERCNEGFCTIAHQPQQSSTLSFHLPINHWDEFSEIMNKVKDDEVKRQLVTFLSKMGGKDMTSLVNSILIRLLTNSFATQCNWKGQRGNKYALEKTPLLSIVHGAVTYHVGQENTTEEEIKGQIQTWLKQASRRTKTLEEREY
ncbi:hypothetical protein J437_LFUL018643 [Ladona fulva]|uniref:DUF4806 domain-containing protein n=1 Tax=Ladona fulva TaxID=123851 RepID=A0A8K0KNM6_LADFU|nr:hypothetical protein J437_LFUL018643 [Ladona fulva]